ncbi:MAG: ABC transporter substrate-binding protein [Paenibacillus sp.]|uniref:ABC transporter substrate-binding protein n=1 Tax=Paenibacillus sp. TaxID=58172 RepID=UPI0028FDD606|nr:ABC transporter substrate-binding protein [Paenibacillus sp.]MDU2243594.1 ABC transporter substrate-binding protein [Paenibacillus sp.]
MRITEDYLRLRKAFPAYKEREPFGISMGELAEVLFCTPRNAKLIIMKMVELEWIGFLSGRGRGHTSELTFLVPAAALLLQEAQERVKRGDVPGAFDWLKAGEEFAAVRPQFLEWLTAYFGYQAEQINGDHLMETLRLPIYREIVSLDPADAIYTFDTHMVHQIYSRLVEYDAGIGGIARGIAHAWESNGAATAWTFYLYKGVQFHDGRELTAEDVRASLLRLKERSGSHGWLMAYLKRIELLSRYTVKIVLEKPNKHFLLYMSHYAASILPRDYTFETGKLPIGSGPYRLAEWHTGMCVLEAFPCYYGHRGIIDRIEVIIVPENEAGACFGTSPGVLTIVTGEFEVPSISELPRKQTVTGVLTLTLNVKKDSILRSLPFRKALAHGIDRQRMVDELGEPRTSEATGLRLEENPCHGDSLYLPEAAAKHLRLSEYDGQPLRLYTYARHEVDAYWLKEQYEALGIRIEVHIVTWTEMIDPAVIATADMVLFEEVSGEGPIRQLEYLQSGKSFIRNALDEEVARRIDEYAAALLREERIERRLAEMDRVLNETYSCVFLVTKAVRTIFHSSLQGVKVNSKGWVDFHSIWFRGLLDLSGQENRK